MIYEVIVDISNSDVDRVFDYSSPSQIPAGSRVKVPFGGREIEGYVMKQKDETQVDATKLKEIRSVEDFSAIGGEMLELADFLAEHFNIRKIDSLRLCLPAQMRGGRVKELTRKVVSINGTVPLDEMLSGIKKNAAKQRELLLYLTENRTESLTALSEKYGAASVKALREKGFVNVEDTVMRRTPYRSLSAKTAAVSLTQEQSDAVKQILQSPNDTYLIFGVTGSGKTEVYMSVIDSMLQKNKTAIMLVPEISLTPQFLGLFRMRYGDKVAILHSGLSSGERYDEWLRLKRGEAKIALGARSAVFAPLTDIGVIILDEEHDSSYQSDSNPRYNTLDVAEFRRSYNNAALVLGSATPAVTTFNRTKDGSIKLIQLKNRINRMPLPEVRIVDMAQEVRSGNKNFFSSVLLAELEKTVAAGSQAMLFLNRRGFSSFVMCNQCGYVPKCTDCDVSLSFHNEDDELKCHYCGKRFRMFELCPSCKSRYIRQGRIGTERVVNALKQHFPDVKVLRMDFDTTQTKESHFKIINSFAAREAQILVGTQMIAKGHDFPDVTLVGIIDGDQSLHFTDYRANERTFQLLTQVSGRCGRADKSGIVVLQTHSPRHFVLQLAARQDYLGFFNREINIREATKFPPFATVIRVLVQGENEENCIAETNSLFAHFKELQNGHPDDMLFCQKMKSPVKRIEKKYRYQVLMKLDGDSETLRQKIYAVCGNKVHKDVSVFAEINPQNLN